MSMAETIFFELSMVIAIAALIAILMKSIKQPLIIGYIITGIILGPSVLNVVESSDTLVAFSEIGVAFLLFIVGLNLNFKNLKDLGWTALITAIGQMLLTFLLVYLSSLAIGFSSVPALYIGAALTFSSTIIVVKLLSDKNDLGTLHGKISLGILLVQDFMVILILMFLSSGIDESFFGVMSLTIFKVAGVAILLMFFSIYALPGILNFIAKSQELLFLFGISWVMVLSVVLNKLGFSIEIGALFAGISLASSPFHFEIGGKLKPLRDFFIILFFILLGSQMVLTLTSGVILKILILTVIVVAGKPLIAMVVLGFLGYKKRVGFLSGTAIAQISEFSLILVILGASLGHLTQETVSIATFVGLLSIACSTYMILYSSRLYGIFSRYLYIFERRNPVAGQKSLDENFKVILFGYNRVGYSLIKSFKKLNKKFLIVDYNPEIIGMLSSHGIPCKYGDASDTELVGELGLGSAELVISTIPQMDINLLLLEKTRAVNKKTVVVMTSHQIDDAFRLYEAGANYVIMPHFLGGEHASALIERFGTNINKFLKERVRHIEELNQRKVFGHEHPTHNA